MDNKDLEMYAQDKMSEYQHLFDEVKSICDELLQNPNSPDINVYYSNQDKLTGIYGSLNTIYKQTRALKENKEAEYYNRLKLECDANGTKFVSAAAERKASSYVAPLRLLRNVLEGYVESIVMSINTCRAHIYEHQKEHKYDN